MWTKPAPCMWRREEHGFVLLIERSRGEFGYRVSGPGVEIGGVSYDLAGAKRAAQAALARHAVPS